MSIQVNTDSNGVSIIEILNLSQSQYKKIIDLMTNKKVNSLEYKFRFKSSAKISWIDAESLSLGIKVDSFNHFDILDYINNLIDY